MPSNNNPPPPAAPAFTVSPPFVRLQIGATQQFAASYGTSSPGGVTWQINGVAGGNEVFGTISTSGLYTAPAIVPPNARLRITAIPSDKSTSGTAFVLVGSFGYPHFAYVASASDDSIQVFAADDQTGMLDPRSTVFVGGGKGPTSLAIHPTGKFVYSLNRGSNDISVFVVDPTTGGLSDAGIAPVPGGPYRMVFSAKGDFAYASCDTASTIAIFAVDASGALSPASAASYTASGGRLQDLAISPDSRFLYVVNRDTGEIISLAINQNDGSLSPINSSPPLPAAEMSSIAANEQNAYAGGRDNLVIFHRDPSSGVLRPVRLVSSGGNAPEVFSNLSDGFLLGINTLGGRLFSFELDNVDGLEASGPPVGTGTSPVAGAVFHGSDFNTWVYLLNRDSGTSSPTGSIGIYSFGYAGAYGPQTTIPTALTDPTGFVITP